MGGTTPEVQKVDPTTGEDIPSDVPDPYKELIPTGQRITAANIKDKPSFELVIDPVTGGIAAVKVLNTLRFETPPVLSIVSSTGQGAVIRPIFGPIPEPAQQGVLTVIDCSR